GLPLVGSDVVGIRDLVNTAKSGVLFPSNDPNALCDAVRTLHGDPGLARRLATSGHDWVTRHGSLDVMIAHHAGLYRRLSGLHGNVPSDHSGPSVIGTS